MKKLVMLVAVLVVLVSVVCAFAQTPVSLKIQRVPSDIISFTGDPGVAYKVQSSVDLTNWTDIVQLGGTTDGVHSFTNLPTQEHLFYRTLNTTILNTNTYEMAVSVTLDSASPLAGTIQIFPEHETANVVLAVFDIKSAGVDGTLQEMSLNIVTAGVTNVNELFSSIQIRVGSTLYSASSISSSGVVMFGNLSIPLPANLMIPIVVVTTIAKDINGYLDGATASVSFVASGKLRGTTNNPVVIDSSFCTQSVIDSTNFGSILTFDGSLVRMSNVSLNLGSPIIGTDGSVVAYSVSIAATITAGNSSIFVAKNPSNSISTIVLSRTSFDFVGNIITTPATIAGDGVDYFIVPPGTSRFINIAGVAHGNGQAQTVLSISALNWGTDPSDLLSHKTMAELQHLLIVF